MLARNLLIAEAMTTGLRLARNLSLIVGLLMLAAAIGAGSWSLAGVGVIFLLAAADDGKPPDFS